MKRLIPFLLLIALLVPVFSVSASGTVPTFRIDAVVKGESVTITTYNFPAGDTFNVRMGKIGTRGISGTLVTTQDSGSGGSFTATYTIPESLKNDYLIAIRLESPTSGYYAFNWFYNNSTDGSPAPVPAPFVIPTFRITEVEKDNTVTIETKNFPADDSFKVTMGYMGTRGIDGIEVETQDSGEGGTFTATYNVPAALKGQYQIAIRLESPTSGFYAYNWFYNNSTSPAADPPPVVDPPPAVLTIPTFRVDSVVKNKSVTITTADFPAGDTFTVTMGYMGSRGINGIVVTAQNSGDGGSFSATYEIPEALFNQQRIAIRLESASSGYYAYNWFYNTDGP